MARLFACLLLLVAAPLAAQVPVAAAASLRYALDDAAAAFTKATGERVRISYAASGNLVQQIEAGAPYQLFLSADEDHVFRLADKGLTPDRGTAYAVGRLVYITPPGSALLPDSGLRSLKAGLADGRIRRLAIANPETAPYGARTVEALKASGLWTQAQPRLVTGENIAQAFQFVASGAADAGFTSLSLAISPGFKGRYALVPANLHQPLTQRMVLLKSATPPARRFHDWLLSPSGQKLLARHGYRPPTRSTRSDQPGPMEPRQMTL